MSKKTKIVPVTLTPELHEEAKKISKELFGKVNVSGLFAYYIKNNKPLAGRSQK